MATEKKVLIQQMISSNPEPVYFKSIDTKITQTILAQVVERWAISWEEVGISKLLKECILQSVVYPILNPEAFEGALTCRSMLLFGPSGIGKIVIGKAIAQKMKATLFNISPDTLYGSTTYETVKLVKTLFVAARVLQPSVIFIDEVESILKKRSKRDKCAFSLLRSQLLEMAEVKSSDRVVVVGATSRPKDLDKAAITRFDRRLLIPVPDTNGRHIILSTLLKRAKTRTALSEQDTFTICNKTIGFSPSKLKELAAEAVLGPKREALFQLL